jgi:hypothetical protein
MAGSHLEDISLPDYSAIERWCAALGCSEAQLAEAIGAVGHSSERVEAYLARRSEQRLEAGPSRDERWRALKPFFNYRIVIFEIVMVLAFVCWALAKLGLM